MSIEWITLLLFGTMFVLMAAGLPIAWILGGSAVIFAFLLWGPQAISMGFFGVTQVMGFGVLVCVPLFVFMGMMLAQAGIVDRFYTAMLNWLGFLPGSLALVTVGASTVLAAMVGDITPATLTMGTIALPVMLKRRYNHRIALGCIQAGAALGFLIPPSTVAILYAVVAKQSIGQFFAGGLIPGVMLSTMFMIYIVVRCSLQPHIAPVVPREERVGRREKFVSLRALILPVFIVVMVLGAILLGITTPVEASAMGAIASIIAAAVSRRLTWQGLKTALTFTLRLSAIVAWIFVGALAFGKVYQALGAPQLIQEVLDMTHLGPIGILIMIQLSYFLLGMVLDDTAILFICLPIYIPIAISLDFNLVWFGVLYIINMQMAFLTPPFGYCLYLLKSVVPKDITMVDIYNSVWPFVVIQGIGLGLCIIFPDIVLWLPRLLFAIQ